MNTSVIFLGLIIIVCILLVTVIMVQNPKGSGLSSTFGGSSGQQMGGVKKTDDFLTKSTWTLATILLVLILLYNVVGIQGQGASESRIMESEDAPAAPTQNPDADQQDASDEQTIDINDAQEPEQPESED